MKSFDNSLSVSRASNFASTMLDLHQIFKGLYFNVIHCNFAALYPPEKKQTFFFFENSGTNID